MDIFSLLYQIFILLLVISCACLATKVGILKDSDTGIFTRLISQVTLPFTLLSAVDITLSSEQRQLLPIIFGLFMVFYAASVFWGQRLSRAFRLDLAQGVLFSNGIAFPNGVFIGLPLLQGLFGNEVYLYVALSTIAFSLIFFTYGVKSMQPGRKFVWKDLITPCNIATLLMLLILIFEWQMPAIVLTVCSNLGAITTPLSLVVIGIMLAGSNIRAMVSNRFLYLVCLFRNLLLPLLMIFVLRLLPLTQEVRFIMIILYSCPCATLVSVFARQYQLQPKTAGEMILWSTILSVVTMPLISWLALMLL